MDGKHPAFLRPAMRLHFPGSRMIWTSSSMCMTLFEDSAVRRRADDAGAGGPRAIGSRTAASEPGRMSGVSEPRYPCVRMIRGRLIVPTWHKGTTGRRRRAVAGRHLPSTVIEAGCRPVDASRRAEISRGAAQRGEIEHNVDYDDAIEVRARGGGCGCDGLRRAGSSGDDQLRRRHDGDGARLRRRRPKTLQGRAARPTMASATA